MKNIKIVGGKNMARKNIFSHLGAITLALGVLMSSLTFSFAVENNEYINSNVVHTDTYNLDGIKNYVQFNVKKDSNNYQLKVNNDCYLYGWSDNTNVFSANKSGGSEYYTFTQTDLSTGDWVTSFDSQKASPEGYKTLFDYFVHANTEITKSYTVGYYTSEPEDMEKFNALGLTTDEQNKYFIPTRYAIIDFMDTEHKALITDTEYNALDDATKALYSLHNSAHYSVPNTMSYVLASNANLLVSGYDLTLDPNIGSYMVYDAYKNYIGTFKLSDIPSLYTSDFSDFTAEPSLTAEAIVKDYDGNPIDTAYVDIKYRLGNGLDYITSVVDTKSKENLLIYGSPISNAIRVTLYDIKNKDYKLEVTTHKGVKATVVAKVTEAGKGSIKYGDLESIPLEENIPDDSVPAPKVKFEGTDVETTDTYLSIKMKTDIPAMMTFNNTTNGVYDTSSDFLVYANGTYYYTAVGENGKETTGSIKIDSFKSTDETSSETSSGSNGKEVEASDDSMIFFDSADEGYDTSILPQTGLTATMIIISVLLIIAGVVLLIKGGKINVRKK